MALPKWIQFFRSEAAPEPPVFDSAEEVEYLEAGDRVWVEFPAEFDSWDGRPSYRPGELVFTDPAAQQGFVVYLSHHNLIAQDWFSAERVYRREQRVSFDRPDTDAGRSAMERKMRVLTQIAEAELKAGTAPEAGEPQVRTATEAAV